MSRGLNENQRAAAEANVNAPLLVVAGAGSGKTMTMIRRIENIVRTSGCKPHEVLAITFTRNACDEMRERLAAISPTSAGASHKGKGQGK